MPSLGMCAAISVCKLSLAERNEVKAHFGGVENPPPPLEPQTDLESKVHKPPTSSRVGAAACVPRRVTETAAARFANSQARRRSAPSLSATARPALKTSPAAV